MAAPATTVPAKSAGVPMGRSATATASSALSAAMLHSGPNRRSTSGARGAPAASISTGRLESTATAKAFRPYCDVMSPSPAAKLVIGWRRFRPAATTSKP